MSAVIFNILLRLRMLLIRQFRWRPMLDKTRHPETTQQALLMDILQANKDTVFGKEHGFADIRSYHDFSTAVAVQSYEDLIPYIEKQEQQQKPYLNISQPIIYAQTSGTTGKPKYIPIIKSTVRQYRHSQHIVAYAEYKDIPGVYDGKILAITSPAEEGKLETGTPYGSMSGLIHQSMPRFVYNKYVVPQAVLDITDYDLKYYLITAFALASEDITLIATANPATLLKIHHVIHDRWHDLIKDIGSGNSHGLAAKPDRAAKLADIKSLKQWLSFADLWPQLKSVTTWTGGSCSVLIPRIRKLLPPTTKIVEMGYLASEFRGSITVDVLRNKCIPTIHENFFEFMERDSWESDKANFLTVDQIKEGKQYYIFVTTRNGLYRYFINDIIEVDGRYHNTPTIRFVQKGKGVTNLVGEKIYENQAVAAIQKLQEELNLEFDFFIILGCPRSLQYSLFIETEPFDNAASLFDKYVGQLNIEFTAKQQSGRLQQTSVMFLQFGTAEIYKKHCIDNGQRDGQFKMIKLQYVSDCSFNFDDYVRA